LDTALLAAKAVDVKAVDAGLGRCQGRQPLSYWALVDAKKADDKDVGALTIALQAAKLANGKAVDARGDAKNADDKAVHALTTALLIPKQSTTKLLTHSQVPRPPTAKLFMPW
jgi:hypothetical protein